MHGPFRAALFLCALFAGFLASSDADARPRQARGMQAVVSQVDDSRYIGQGGMVYREPVKGLKRAGRTVARKAHRATIKVATVAVESGADVAAGSATVIYAGHLARAARLSLEGYPAPLIAKVREIEGACPGSKLISAFRPGAVVRGSGRPSLHATKRAADMRGNPSCIYARLRSWPGGVSTDYAQIRHVHFSYAPNGREWGARFAHYGSRQAKKRHHHYAAVRP